MLNIAVKPRVEVRIQLFENHLRKRERVRIHAENYGETIVLDPEKPDFRRHPILQGAVNSLPIPEEVELMIALSSLVPGGSSTGTSAAACVALLGGLAAASGQELNLADAASLALRVETDKLGLQSGIQDQLCSAYGGICFIDMKQYPAADVQKLSLDEHVKEELAQRLALVYMGSSHSSSALHEEVIAFLETKSAGYDALRTLKELAGEAREHLIRGDFASFGDAMVRNNECQRSLHAGLISGRADDVISIAKRHEAAGWKVNGAGGEGGSLTILGSRGKAERDKMLDEIEALGKGIRPVSIGLEDTGLDVDVNN